MPDSILAILIAVPATSLLVWFLQNGIRHWHARDLERYKGELRLSFDTELEAYKSKLFVETTAFTERMKSALRISTSELQARFAKLHEKVAEVLSELHARLTDQVSAFERYVSDWEPGSAPGKKERREHLSEATVRLIDYFRLHHLYLPRGLADRIRTFQGKLVELAQEFRTGVEDRKGDRETNHQISNKVLTVVKEGARAVFESLEDEFRKILGASVEADE